ncbi:MAG: DUF4115 domain-containing protein [Deltaproteobacteria bacterium]
MILSPDGANPANGKSANDTTSESSLKTETSPPPESTSASQEKASPAEDKPLHTLTASFSQVTWVRTEIDHKEVKEAIFKPGTSTTWQAEENIKLVLGNSGGVSLVFDGTPVELHGKGGKVLRLSFP